MDGNSQHSQALAPPAVPLGEKRSRRGCITCRARRVKCDEQRPVCQHCLDRNERCEWKGVSGPSVIPERSISGAGGPRNRSRASACTTCRLRKVRCMPSSIPGVACSRCDRLVQPCSLAGHDVVPSSNSSHVPGSSMSPHANILTAIANSPAAPMNFNVTQDTYIVPRRTLPSSMEAIMSDKVELLTLTKIYFSIVHNYGFLCFIHEPSFRKLLDERKTPRQLTLIMMACALRFSGNASDAALKRADTLFEEAMSRLRNRFFTGYGAFELMAVMLAQAFEHSRGKLLSSWMLVGVAVRMMQFHSLHIFDETYGPVRSITLNPLLKREALRRLAWSVWYMDTMVDAGRFGVHNLTEEAFRIRLPGSESSFLRGIETDTCTLQEFEAATNAPTGLDKASYVILFATIRRRLCHYVSFDLHYKKESSASRQAKLSEMEHSLDKVERSLPTDIVYSQENLYIHANDGQLFVLLHVLKHVCWLIVGKAKSVISVMDPTKTQLAETACRQRIQHAISLSEVVRDAVKHDISCDPHVGFQAYSALETLVIQPAQLRMIDVSVDSHSSEYLDPIRPLLHLIRQLSEVFTVMKSLRVEACARLVRHGCGYLLNGEDNELYQSQLSLSSSEEREFGFESFRWHRLEHCLQRDPALEAPLAAEALLDLGATGESRQQSPLQSSISLPGTCGLNLAPQQPNAPPQDAGMSNSIFPFQDTSDNNSSSMPQFPDSFQSEMDVMRWTDLGYEPPLDETLFGSGQVGSDQSPVWPVGGQATPGMTKGLTDMAAGLSWMA